MGTRRMCKSGYPGSNPGLASNNRRGPMTSEEMIVRSVRGALANPMQTTTCMVVTFAALAVVWIGIWMVLIAPLTP